MAKTPYRKAHCCIKWHYANCHAQLCTEINAFSRLTQSVTINGYLEEDRIVLAIVSGLDFLVFSELCSSKASVLFELGSAKEWFILWARIRFDAEFDVFSLRVIFVLIQKIEGDAVVERPLEQTVECTWNSTKNC